MRGQGPSFAFWLAPAVAIALSAAMSSARGAGQLLLEVAERSTSPAAAAGLEELREHLRAHGVVVDAAAIAELDNEVLPMPGRWDQARSLTELTAQLDAGVRSYLRGNFRVAAQQLDAALAVAWRNPALVVSDSTARQWMTQALVSLALARSRLGEAELARSAIEEQIRSFPELPVTHAAFGRRGDALYARARRALEAGPRGGLLVDVSDPNARIYINEVGRGRGGAFAADMLPGTYRVLVMVHDRARRYRVSVHANGQARLLIDWSADAAFVVRGAGLALELDGATGAAKESALLRLGRRLQFHDAVVIGARHVDGRELLWGAVLQRRTGKRLRASMIDLPAAGSTELARFAAFLAAGDFAHDDYERPRGQRAAIPLRGAVLPVMAMAQSPRSTPPRPPVLKIARGMGYGLVGAGVALAGVAAVITATQWRDGCDPFCTRDPSGLAWAAAFLATGLVSCGVGVVLVADARRAQAAPAVVSMVPSSLTRSPRVDAMARVWWQF